MNEISIVVVLGLVFLVTGCDGLSCACGHKGHGLQEAKRHYERTLKSLKAVGIQEPVCEPNHGCSIENAPIMAEFGLRAMCFNSTEKSSYFLHCTYSNQVGCIDFYDAKVCYCDSSDFCNEDGSSGLFPKAPSVQKKESNTADRLIKRKHDFSKTTDGQNVADYYEDPKSDPQSAEYLYSDNGARVTTPLLFYALLFCFTHMLIELRI